MKYLQVPRYVSEKCDVKQKKIVSFKIFFFSSSLYIIQNILGYYQETFLSWILISRIFYLMIRVTESRT